MYDYYITVARWSPSFNEEEPIRKILTWVRFPKLPIHYFNHTAVNRIGNHIGKTIRMDLATSEGARARYARVCVEIDLSKPLLGKYMIGDRVFYIEYESIENFCYLCGLYGCKAVSCPSCKPVAIPSEPPMGQEPDKVCGSEERDTGSWMVVSQKQKKKPVVPKSTQPETTANKFGILENLPDDGSGRTGSHASIPKLTKNQGAKTVHTDPKQNAQAMPRRTVKVLLIGRLSLEPRLVMLLMLLLRVLGCFGLQGGRIALSQPRQRGSSKFRLRMRIKCLIVSFLVRL
ncbi:hypothetical protein LINPERHAP2_LOCUS35739 [Linum perenne]